MGKGAGQAQIGYQTNQKGTAAGSNSGGGVPDSIQCQVCKRTKAKGQYANRQLQKYNSFNKGSSRGPGLIRVTCKTCTPGQTTELTCYICDATKGLIEFAKNQRKDPDKARCLKCVTRVLETEPDMSPPSSGAEEEEEDTDDDGDDWSNGAKKSASKTSYKAPGLTSHGSKNRGSQYTASSAAGTDHYASSLSSRDTAASGNIGGIAEPRPSSYAGSAASSVATTRASPHTRTAVPAPSAASSVVRNEGAWETVGVAGPPVAKYGTPWGARAEGSSTATPSYRSASASRVAPMDMKSNGWAKVPKVAKGKEQKWGEGNVAEYNKTEEGGEDIWAKYGRDLRDARAGKIPKKKKTDRVDSDDD